jgi:hypothetical protein
MSPFMLCSNHVVCYLVSPDLLSPLVSPWALYVISGMHTLWDPEYIMCIYFRRSVQSTRVSHAPIPTFSPLRSVLMMTQFLRPPWMTTVVVAVRPVLMFLLDTKWGCVHSCKRSCESCQ